MWLTSNMPTWSRTVVLFLQPGVLHRHAEPGKGTILPRRKVRVVEGVNSSGGVSMARR